MYEISVVIPTYNRADKIENAIQSVIEQSGQEQKYTIEQILIIDDASTDNTEEIIRRINNDKISYYRIDKNTGAAHARNYGVEKAECEWIAFQDSDDLWQHNKLKKQIDYLEIHKDCGMIVHPVLAFFKDGREVITPIPQDDDQASFLAVQNFAGTPTMLIRKDKFLACNGFDEELKALEDWDLALRYSFKHPIGIVKEPLIKADMTIEGVSSNMANYYDARCRMIAKSKNILMERGLLNKAMEAVLLHARENNVLEQVGKMLEMSLINIQ